MKKRRTGKLYVVGYTGNDQTALYSNEAWVNGNHHEDGGIGKMTFSQAKRHLRELLSGQHEVAIFKVVPVFKITRKKLNK